MTAPAEVLPIRYCHGCGQYDNHPRVHHIQNINDPVGDKLYHYDCAPDHVLEDHPEIKPGIEAAGRGVKGADLRDYMTYHAAAIPEAPAEPVNVTAFLEGLAGKPLESLPTELVENARQATLALFVTDPKEGE